MPSKRKRDSHPATDQAEETPTEEPPAKKSTAQAAKASADATATVDHIDDLLDDVDESLNTSLGFQPGEVVDPAEVEERAKAMVGQYTQKGGQ